MINRVAVSEGGVFPKVLVYTDIRSYAFTAIFIALAVATPWVFHHFYLAGPTFLPMHIFVLLAGLLFGWRTGLIVGLFTPLVSYGVSGMPVLTLLPQIVVEISFYGLAAGMLREKLKLRAIWSLLGAMIAGRLALLLTVTILSLGGAIYSPLSLYTGMGAEENPLAVLWSAVLLGWPGIVIQIVSIPLIVKLLERFLERTQSAKTEK
jgi:hypothetical protein